MPFRVVEDLLEQGLSQSLRDAALDLALDEAGIDDASAVMDDDVAFDLDQAGCRVHRHAGDVASVGDRRRRRVVCGGRRQPEIFAFRDQEGRGEGVGGEGDVAEADPHFRRPLDVGMAVGKLDVGGAGLQEMTGVGLDPVT